MVEKREFRGRDRWLLFAFLAGPMSALAHLTVSYALVPESCARGSKMILHVSSAAFFVVAIVGMWIGWHYSRAFVDANGLSRERTRWLALVAMAMSIFSAIVIVAMSIPNVILRSCD